jgi:hypothetical protein
VVVFYLIQFTAVMIGAERSERLSAVRRGRIWLASAAGVLLFLVLIQPLAEAANACYIGTGFLIHPSC